MTAALDKSRRLTWFFTLVPPAAGLSLPGQGSHTAEAVSGCTSASAQPGAVSYPRKYLKLYFQLYMEMCLDTAALGL